MHRTYGEHADFLTIYILEAHPTDEWQVGDNHEDEVLYEQPTTIGERLELARDFVAGMDFEIPLAVDTMSDEAMHCFAAWPERLYIVETDGTIAYKGGVGPVRFRPEEVEAWLAQRFPEEQPEFAHSP